MYLLSRIIAKEWFKALAGAIIVLFLLVTVGDIINGFLQNYSFHRVFMEYILKMPDLMGKMLPISSLLASLFAINKLKSHSELMAILAGGYSAERIYSLILLCSLTVGFAQFINLGFIQPKANKVKRQEFEKSRTNESKYLARSKIGKSGLLWYKSSNYFTSFSAYDPKSNELKNVTVYFQNDKGKMEKIYKSSTAKFVEAGKWELQNVSSLEMLDGEEFPKTSTQKSLIVNLQETPTDFGQFEADITTLHFFDLSSFIKRLNKTGINSSEYEIMLFEKLSLAIICMVFALFPISGVFNPNRRASGFGKNVVFTLTFSIAFWLIYSWVIAMGNSGRIPPLLATMGIPCIFMLYIVWVFSKHRSL